MVRIELGTRTDISTRKQTPHDLLPRVFGELRKRYLSREGGYTRVTRTDGANTYDQAEYAILEFVDGPRDSRYMMTALAVARDQAKGVPSNELTLHNVDKVTRYRGREEFDAMVTRMGKRWGSALAASWEAEPAHVTAKK